TQGSVLMYREHNQSWYRTNVYAKGEWHTGFISKDDVDTATQNPTLLTGVALNDSTSVYASTSLNSSVRKSYTQGSILKYYTFTNDWYQTSVYIKGKKKTGYIHKSHVENAVENQTLLTGVALLQSTSVYEKASTSSKPLKSYDEGSILLYNTFSPNWY